MDINQLEQTLVLIKPDGLKNSITGFILSQLSEFHTGSRFAATKIVNVNRILAEEHYAEHQGKPFFESLIEYITGRVHYPNEVAWKRRVIAIIYMGPDVLKTVRRIAGPTNPHDARNERPGCLRSLGTVVPILGVNGEIIDNRMDNLIHGSATLEEAEREIKLWFEPRDIPPRMQAYETVVCKSHYYFKEGQLLSQYEPGSICLMGPGDVAWKSDMEAIQQHERGEPATLSLNAIVAKYLINRSLQED